MVLFFILFSLLGLVVGSFLNVLIYRLENKKRKTLFGRSFCPVCGKKINFYDNIPVISWIILRGKCRSCKKPISVQYPLVELGTAFVFGLIGYRFITMGFQGEGLFTPLGIIELVFWLFFASSLLVILVYDLKHQIIPDEVIYPAIVGGLALVVLNLAVTYDFKRALIYLLSGLLAGSFFFMFAALSKGKWMGGGDIKLAFFMGISLGLGGVLVALYLSFILGGIFGTSLLVSGKKKLGSKIPFGPFLVTGTLLSYLFGEKIISFYVNMFM